MLITENIIIYYLRTAKKLDKMHKLNSLVKGDTVAVVSTARKVSLKELEPAIKLLKQWGLKFIFGESIEANFNQFAGDDDLRASDFQKMMGNPEVKAIWCARGGYGTVRIIDKLDFSEFKKNPKWIIGYSDITVLHSHIHNFGIETLHAQMPLEIEIRTPESANSIKQVLFGETYKIQFENTNACNVLGSAKGELVGGNLSVLHSLCGSPSKINTDGKILFIEDLDEYLYNIDRMMMNLKRNGMLKNLDGLIVGGMADMHDNKIPFGKNVSEIILDVVAEYEYPICFDFPAGHIEDNRALIMGRDVELDIQENQVSLNF